MNIKVEDISPCCKKVIVEVPSQKVDAAFDRIIDLYQKNARIDGFRKGFAPKELVFNHFNKEIKEDVMDEILGDTYEEVISQTKLKPILILNIEGTPTRGSLLKYELMLEVVPNIKLPRYKGIPLKKPEDIIITDQMVDERINKMFSEYGTYIPSTHQKIEEGNSAIIDYEGKIDGQTISSRYPQLKNSFLDRGQDIEVNKILDYLDFTPHIKGMQIGEERDIEITFPPKYPVKQLEGKKVVYHVKIKSILEWKPLDIKEVFKDDSNKLEEIKKRVRATLEEEEEERKRKFLRDEAINYLLAKTEMEVPPSMIAEEVTRIANYAAFEALLHRVTDFNKEQFVRENQEKLMETAAKGIKTAFILYEIAKAENIEVSDEEVNSYIEKRAQSIGRDPKEYKDFLEKKNKLNEIKSDIRENKTIDWIIANAEIGGSQGNIFKRLFKR